MSIIAVHSFYNPVLIGRIVVPVAVKQIKEEILVWKELTGGEGMAESGEVATTRLWNPTDSAWRSLTDTS